MFKNLSLKLKIFYGFMAVCFGLGVVVLTAYQGMNHLVKTYNQLADVSVPNLGHISGMRARGRQIHAESLKLGLYANNADESGKAAESLQAALKRYQVITNEYLVLPFSPGEEEISKNIEAKFAPVKAAAEEVLRLFNSTDTDKEAKIKTVLLSFETPVKEHQASLLKLDDYHVELGEKWAKESQELSRFMAKTLLIIGLSTLCLGFFIARYLANSINAVLKEVTSKLHDSSEKVAMNSQTVAKASQQLAVGTTEQAEALHETVASTNEIAAMTEKTSENSTESLKRAELSRTASHKGQHSLDEMMRAISEIGVFNQDLNQYMKKSNLEIQEIVNLVLEIGKKTKLIDDIVFQTKLLSFNVSVEAARAGEHGKGFAVVAHEMSKLADMSGLASKEISSMLAITTQKATSIVEGSQTSMHRLITVGDEKVSLGRNVAGSCKVVLEEIIGYVGEMCSMIRETTLSTQEQSRGVSEINKAMGQIDIVTTQNAQASEQCSYAAQVLMSEVEQTRDVIQDLLAVVHGQSHASNVEAFAPVKKMTPKKKEKGLFAA